MECRSSQTSKPSKRPPKCIFNRLNLIIITRKHFKHKLIAIKVRILVAIRGICDTRIVGNRHSIAIALSVMLLCALLMGCNSFSYLFNGIHINSERIHCYAINQISRSYSTIFNIASTAWESESRTLLVREGNKLRDQSRDSDAGLTFVSDLHIIDVSIRLYVFLTLFGFFHFALEKKLVHFLCDMALNWKKRWKVIEKNMWMDITNTIMAILSTFWESLHM